jgi:hypothetical protein
MQRCQDRNLGSNFFRLLVAKHGLSLRGRSLHLALSGSLGLRTLGIHFVLESLLAQLLGLSTVNLVIQLAHIS